MATKQILPPVVRIESPDSNELLKSFGQPAYVVALAGMPRAPSDIAGGALRRTFPEILWESVFSSDPYTLISPFRLGMETILHPYGIRSNMRCYFTLHFSCFEVERGRLGEVVSLVGDCRPPPPGNPRRPIIRMGRDKEYGWEQVSQVTAGEGSIFLP